MKEQHTIHNHPLVDAMIVKYQELNEVPSWSSAAIELLLRGIEQWVNTTEDDIHWPNEEELLEEYQEWKEAIFKDRDRNRWVIHKASDTDKSALHRFIAEQIIPQYGGKRPGQGRPKGSKNKPKVEATSDYEQF